MNGPNNSDARLHKQKRPWGVVERVKGIEPSSVAWEATALPLSYTRDGVTLSQVSAVSAHLR